MQRSARARGTFCEGVKHMIILNLGKRSKKGLVDGELPAVDALKACITIKLM